MASSHEGEINVFGKFYNAQFRNVDGVIQLPLLLSASGKMICRANVRLQKFAS